MNDIGYVIGEYRGSQAETGVNTATMEQLEMLRHAYLGAIYYHQKEENPLQVQFFESGLKLVDKRLKLKSI